MTKITIETTKTINQSLLLEQLKSQFGSRLASIGRKPGVHVEIALTDAVTGDDTDAAHTIITAHDHTQQSTDELNVAQLQTVKTARANIQTFVDTANGEITNTDVVQVVKLLCRYVLYVTRN